MNIIRLFAALLFALLPGAAQADDFAAIPPLTGHVVDNAGMLDTSQRSALENVLRDYEARTGSQISVLLINSTAPEAIEQYSIRVADAWKIGRKNIDDGVILVVAKDNPKALRRLRIEAGRGVQGVLTDAQSKRILQDVIAPHFRQNDFYGGLVAGISAITSLLDQEHFAPPAAKQQSQADEVSYGDVAKMVIFLVFAFALVATRSRSSRRGLSSNGWSTAAGVILGSALSRQGRGGFGDFGGSGGGFGSSGGGGFSGGGGGFDGGGASGDW